MRGGKGLVQVEVHDIDAQIARPGNPQQRVQIRAIAINQPAGLMDQFDDFEDILVEQAQRVGVGEHQACQAVIAQLPQRFQVNIAMPDPCER